MPVRDINKTTHTATYPVPPDLAYGSHRALYAKWEVRLWKPSDDDPQPAHFSVTGELRYPNAHDIKSGGRLHALLLKFAKRGLLDARDAIVPSLLRWHLFDVANGPMHYVANGVFWYKIYLRRQGKLPKSANFWDRDDRPEDAEALKHFKSTIIFGALDDDKIPDLPELPRAPDVSDAYVYEPKVAEQRQIAWRRRCAEIVDETLTPWLNGRLPRLLALFEADMVRWFGPEILVSPDGKDSP